jgi:hypothetical protein
MAHINSIQKQLLVMATSANTFLIYMCLLFLLAYHQILPVLDWTFLCLTIPIRIGFFVTTVIGFSAGQVLFVCTANVVENIPDPLLDRMEVIRLVGYITDEKMHIARDYLEKSAREGSGVKPEQVNSPLSSLR